MKSVLKTLLTTLFLYLYIFLQAQGIEEPQDFLSSEFHKERRERLREQMPKNAVAIFFSNPVRNRANDVDYLYHQDPDFYYLTGYREQDALLLIFKEQKENNKGVKFNEVLFVQPNNPRAEMWTGRRLGVEGAREKLGFNQAFTNKDFKDYDIDFSTFDKVMFYDFKNDVRDTRTQGDLYDLISWFKMKAGYPDPGNPSLDLEPKKQNLDTRALDKIMNDLRGIKTPEELALIRKAVNISAIGQVEVMKAMKPGMSEREIQGVHEFVYKKYDAEYEGYPSIVGAGYNGCILHYMENYKPSVGNDELVLMDLGAEYHGYTADVTRTIPADGVFSKEQKLIYDLVYEAQEAAIQACKPGVSFEYISVLARNIINEGLADLKIISSPEEQHMFYPHGLSHHIGLDVHDKGNYKNLEENMVITVEPGIYIPENSKCDKKWWGIGVRIEDDILITADGFEILSSKAPRKSEDVEEMMRQASVLEDFILPDLNER